MTQKLCKNAIFIFFVYFILALVFFFRLFMFSPDERRYISGDFYQYFASFYNYVEHIKHGTLPLWNQFVYQGIPTIARADSAFFYPINLFFIFVGVFFNFGFSKLYILYELYAVFHLVLAGFFCYLLARHYKLSQAASFIAGLLFMFTGSMVVLISGPVLLASMAWFPVILLCFDCLLNSRTSFDTCRYILLLALGLAMSHFGGYFQISFYYNILGLALYFAIWSIHEIGSPRLVVKQALFLLISTVISLLLYAVQLLPGLELAFNSNRSTSTLETATYYGVVKPLDVLNFVYPNFYRFKVNGVLANVVPIYAYFGFMGLLLFVLGFKNVNLKKYRYFILLFFFSLFAALGGYLSFYDHLLVLIPGLIKFRNIFKILYLTSFSFSILAGLGYDYILTNLACIKDKLKFTNLVFIALMLMLLLVQILSFLLKFFSHQPYLTDVFAIEAATNTIVVSLLLILASLVVINFSFLWGRKLFFLLVVTITFIDLSNFNQLYIINNSKINPSYFLINDNMEVFRRLKSDTGIYRVKYLGTGFGSYYFPEGMEILNVDGYSSFVLKQPMEFTVKVGALDSSGSDFAHGLGTSGVKYLVVDKEIQNPSLKLLVTDTVAVDNQKYYFRLLDTVINYVNRVPGDKIYLYQNLNFYGMVDADFTTKIVKFNNDVVKLQINAPSSAWLTIKTPYYPGWKAYINSTETTVQKNVSGYITLRVPKGENVVILKFFPSPLFYAGFAISGMTLLSMGLYYRNSLRSSSSSV